MPQADPPGGGKGISEVLHYSAVSKNILTLEEADLYELCNLAGVVFDPTIFRIVVDLLKLNIGPTAIERMLKSITSKRKKGSLEPWENPVEASHSSTYPRGKTSSVTTLKSKSFQSLK